MRSAARSRCRASLARRSRLRPACAASRRYTIEAAGASGGVALRQAYLAIASGAYDLVAVVGVEKVTDVLDGRLEAGLALSRRCRLGGDPWRDGDGTVGHADAPLYAPVWLRGGRFRAFPGQRPCQRRRQSERAVSLPDHRR